MIAKVNEFSVFDGNIVGLLLYNCNVKLGLIFFAHKHECRIANNPKLTIQQYAKTKANTIFIEITSTLYSVRRIRTSLTK